VTGKARTAALRLLVVAVAAVIIAYVAWPYLAGPRSFPRVAQLAAIGITALGVAIALIQAAAKFFGGGGLDAVARAEAEVARLALGEANEAHVQLAGVLASGGQPANTRFTKDHGHPGDGKAAEAGNLTGILDYFQALDPQRLVILGGPGSGKTVLAVELQVRLFDYREQNPRTPVPVLVSAAAYEEGANWPDWLAGYLALTYGVGKKAAASLISDGRILPIIDGLDEMDPPGAGRGQRALRLVSELRWWLSGRNLAPIVVTCRSGEDQARLPVLNKATYVTVMPLNADEAAQYLREHLPDGADQRWAEVLRALEAPPGNATPGDAASSSAAPGDVDASDASGGHLPPEKLATPWQLTLALTAFRDDGDPSRLLDTPPRPHTARSLDNHLLRQYIASAATLHSASRYDPGDVQRWLTAIAEGLARQANQGRPATDIRLDQWWVASAAGTARSLHRAPFWFFAATWFLIFLNAGSPEMLSVVIGLCVMARRAGGPPQAQRLRLRGLATARGIVLMMLGFTVFLLLAVAGWHQTGQAGLVAPVMAALALGIAGATADTSPRATGPRELITADGRYALACGLAWGGSTVVVGSMVVFHATGPGRQIAPEIMLWAALAITAGLALPLSGGLTGVHSCAWARYRAALVADAAHGRSPLRFGRFLDWAHDAGLLRASGVAYQFRHRQLQDWLATQSAARRPHRAARRPRQPRRWKDPTRVNRAPAGY